MERTIGKLGLYPLEAIDIAHDGNPGDNGGPEYYLEDKINLNIVYSVYHTPRTKEEIATELGLTLVYIEERINFLEDNGFIIKTKNDKYTTYVNFKPETYSIELKESRIKLQLRIAEELAEKYVPVIRDITQDINDVYIPSGNRELFDAAVIFHMVANRLRVKPEADISKYRIQTTDGGRYIATVTRKLKASDPDYESILEDLPPYYSTGNMWRRSQKYPSVSSWSTNTRYSSREGGWQENLYSDYEYLYEYIRGYISDTSANSEKFARLRKRKYLNADSKPAIMIMKGNEKEFFDSLPKLDESMLRRFIDDALEYAMIIAKDYPPQMQDLVVYYESNIFDNKLALMVLDILYSNGTFKPLTEEEKITSQLIMFSDILPE